MISGGISYSDGILKSFAPLAILNDSLHPIISMDISRCGKYLVAVNSNNTLFYYSLLNGYLIDFFHNRKIGVSMAKFADDHFTVIGASGKNLKHQLNRTYVWRLDKNSVSVPESYHDAEITTINIGPTELVYTSLDKSGKVMIIDYEELDLIKKSSNIMAGGFDNYGQIWLTVEKTSKSEHIIKFHNFRNHEITPIYTCILPQERFSEDIYSIQFSKSGDYLIVSSKKNTHMIMSVIGDLQYSLICGQKLNAKNPSIFSDISLSPCDKYAIYIDEKTQNFCVGDLKSDKMYHYDKFNPGDVKGVMFSHEYLMFITAGEHIVIWTVDTDKALKEKSNSKNKQIENK